MKLFKKQPTNPRTIFAVVGFGYGTALALVGLRFFGGDHGTALFLHVASAPFGLGFFFWPLVWSLIPVLSLSQSRSRFLWLIGVHYVGLLYSASREVARRSDAVGVAFQEARWLVLLAITIYLAGQMFLWRQFLRRHRNQP
jgi:hypothetical protein